MLDTHGYELSLLLWFYSPASEYRVVDNQLVEWRDAGVPAPTQADIDAAAVDAAAYLSDESAKEARQEGAEAQLAGVTGWATMTEADALASFDASVVDLASAEVIIRALLRMVIALRNQVYPELEGSA